MRWVRIAGGGERQRSSAKAAEVRPGYPAGRPLYFFDLDHYSGFGARILSLLYRHAVYIDILKDPSSVNSCLIFALILKTSLALTVGILQSLLLRRTRMDLLFPA